MNGIISPIMVDGINKNSIQLIQYRYRATTEGSVPSWVTWTPFTYSINNEEYIANEVVLDLDKTASFYVEFMIEDVLNNETELVTVSVGEPILFLDTKLKSVSIGKFPEFANCLEVKGDLIVNGTNINDMLNASTEYIDFKNDTGVDYDARLVLQDDNTLELLGADLYVPNIVSRTFSSIYNSGGYADEYFNIKAKATVPTTASWHVDNVVGTQLIYVPWGSDGGDVVLQGYNGGVRILGNGHNNLNIVGLDHAYVEFYPQGLGNGRKGYMGYGTGGTEVMTISNNADLVINASGRDFRFRALGSHASIYQSGNANLKWLAGSSTIQVRNNADSAYGEIQAILTNASDRRLKSNIELVLDDYLELVKNCPIYSFNMEGQDDERFIGLITDQAPQEIVVKPSDKDEYESINLYAMTSFLWKAVQQLTEKVELLESKVKS